MNSDRAGAALLIAIAIMTILLLVALSFFTVTRIEMNTSENVLNSLKAGFLADAGTAIAMAFLNYDYAIHQMYTSTDHAWRTYFNGAWAAGKQWAWVNGVPLTSGGMPEINLDATPNIRQWFYVPRIQQWDPRDFDRDGNPFVLTASYDQWPLATFLAQIGAPMPPDPVVPNQELDYQARYWPDQQVDTFTDVDNDDDGYDDSIWLPIGADEFFNHDGIDNDLDGMVDEGAGVDNIDNDGDGAVDEPDELIASNGVDDDGDGLVDEADEQSEACVFVYWGGNDGRDNNGDGRIDETDGGTGNLGEQRIYLTAPIHSPYGPVDTPGWLAWAPPGRPDGCLREFTVRRFGVPYLVQPWPGSETVDVIDNDWDLVVSGHTEYFPKHPGWYALYEMYDSPYADSYGDPGRLAGTTHRINTFVYLAGMYFARNMDAIVGIYDVYSSGEPVCELVGRVAVLVNDEATKVNMNVAGGHTYNRFGDEESSGLWRDVFGRGLGDGLGPWEYETRVLPGIGIERSSHLWAVLTGAPKRHGFLLDRDEEIQTLLDTFGAADQPGELAYIWDWCMPGYGRVDDNGNALWMAMDGLDNDGDGLTDEGFRLPPGPVPPEDPNDEAGQQEFERKQMAWLDERAAYTAQLGMFEGIDEPQERRLYRAYRNLVAESDTDDDGEPRDNDYNDVRNEIGELGDRALGTREQLNLARSVGEGTFGDLKPLVTVHSSDPDTTFVHNEAGGLREVSGTKLDLNYARVYEGEVAAKPDITDMLMRDWERHYRPTKFYREARQRLEERMTFSAIATGELPDLSQIETQLTAGVFAAGLRQEDVTLVGSPFDIWHEDLRWSEVALPADNELRAYKLAATVKDFTDRDHRRTELTLFNDADVYSDTWTELATGVRQPIQYTVTGIESIRINEVMVRPVRRVEAEMLYLGSPMEQVLEDDVENAYYRDRHLSIYDPNYFSCQFDFTEVTGVEDDYQPFTLAFDMVQDFLARDLEAEEPDHEWRTWKFPPERAGFAGLEPNVIMGDGCALESRWDDYPDYPPPVAQFRFGPSMGLPPGRYYLTVNTRDSDGVVTVGPFDFEGMFSERRFDTAQIQFAIKYGTYGLPGTPEDECILRDLDEGAAIPWQSNAKVGYENMAYYSLDGALTPATLDDTPSGWLWLPSNSFHDPDPDDVGYQEDDAYTIRIPDYEAIPEDQVYLYIAIRINENLVLDDPDHLVGYLDPASDFQQAYNRPETPGPDPFKLAINFFDFSQEPDHEWIELTNIAEWDPDKSAEEQAIDVGGWYVEIGPPETADENPKLYIPKGIDGAGNPWSTRIAPGGMLLLGINKYDYSADSDDTDLGNFRRNGIGLATNVPPAIPTDLPPLTQDPRNPLYIAVPPTTIEELAGIPDFANAGAPNEMGGSVFEPRVWYDDADPDRDTFYAGYPTVLRDFVDVNGDGIRDALPPDDLVNSTQGDGSFRNYAANKDYFMNKAWDRIVELDARFPALPDAMPAVSAFCLADISDAGADGIDPIAWMVLRGGVFPNYPMHDAIDNDGDTVFLSVDPADHDGDGLPNSPYEGVDEGRWFESADYDPPGSFKRSLDQFGDPRTSPPLLYDVFQGRDIEMAEYAGDDPVVHPVWREFVERRWFPGDCVILTLRDESGGVVDSVTYTERDVVNCAVDDRAPIPICINRMDQEIYAREPLNVHYNTMWPENTMGVDFYRSLERKHPLYSGDRFGVRNRWQATDGRYDDWDESLSLWAYGEEDPVWSVLKFGHALMGSPLRMNFYQRRVEGEFDPADPTATPSEEFDAFLTDAEKPGLWRFRPAPDRGRKLGFIRNRPLDGPGQIAKLPHFALRRNLRVSIDEATGWVDLTAPLGRFEFGHTSYGLEPELAGDEHARSDLRDYEHVDEVLLGDRVSGEVVVKENLGDPENTQLVPTGLPVDLVALAGSGSSNPIVLSVAQAEQPLLYGPTAGQWDVAPEEADWTDATVDPYTQAFTSVRLFAFESGVDSFEQRTMFDGGVLLNVWPGFAGPPDMPLSPAELQKRWMPEDGLDLRRAVYYVGDYGWKRGRDTGPGDVLDPAFSPMALFVWRADAGVENGTYDVHVAIGDTLVDLRKAREREAELVASMALASGILHDYSSDGSGTPLLTGFGEWLLDNATHENVRVLAKCYSDPECYRDPAENLTGARLRDELDSDVLLVPGENGVAYYGTVTIEDNFFAMRIRNWSNWEEHLEDPPLCVFSRVILTPRDRVTGRVNVNTVVTRRADEEVFNPLMGLPGLLPEYDEGAADVLKQDPNIMLADELGVEATLSVPPHNLDPSVLAPHERLCLRAHALMTKRPEWPDGRYYRSAADLLGYVPFFDALAYFDDPAQSALRDYLPPAWQYKTDDDKAEAVWNDPPGTLHLSPVWYSDTSLWCDANEAAGEHVYPLIPAFRENELRERIEHDLGEDLVSYELARQRYNEAAFRYARLFNLVTTRSDVFEIIVTAQSGYGVDANRDGRINYRDPNEFIRTGEKKTRTVYSR